MYLQSRIPQVQIIPFNKHEIICFQLDNTTNSNNLLIKTTKAYTMKTRVMVKTGKIPM